MTILLSDIKPRYYRQAKKEYLNHIIGVFERDGFIFRKKNVNLDRYEDFSEDTLLFDYGKHRVLLAFSISGLSVFPSVNGDKFPAAKNPSNVINNIHRYERGRRWS